MELNKESILQELVNLRQLVFEVTDDCNLACTYCGYGDLYGGYDARRASYMDFSDVKRLMDYLIALWAKHEASALHPRIAISFYGGEPLLNMRFVKDMVSYVELCGIPRDVTYTMTTNAVLLDRYMDYLVEKDFQVLISLDGDAESDSFRLDKAGNPSFERVVRNVQLLRGKYPEFYAKRVNFNAVLHERNSVEGIVTFFKREFGKVPHWGEMNPFGVRPDKRQAFDAIYRDSLQDIRNASDYEALSADLFASDPFVERVWSYIKRKSGNVYLYYDELFRDADGAKKMATGTCIPFSRKLFVTVNGKILPCEKINHTFSYGCVNRNTFEFSLEKVADQFNGYMEELISQCRHCANESDCPYCLYNLALTKRSIRCPYRAENSNLKAEERGCKAYMIKHPLLYEHLMTGMYVE